MWRRDRCGVLRCRSCCGLEHAQLYEAEDAGLIVGELGVLVPLSLAETTELARCELLIERGLSTFVEVGEALLRIRDGRLYRETHRTFEDYCRERWDLKRQRAYELMQASEIVGVLSEISDTVPLPARESHAAELAPLRDEPDELREAWSEAVERHGERPTAAEVREVVDEKRNGNGRMAVHYSSATDEWATGPAPHGGQLALGQSGPVDPEAGGS